MGICDLGCGIEELLDCDLFPDGSLESRNVHVTGEVHRTLTIDWIPSRGICSAEVLCLQANAHLRFFYGQSLYPLGGVPGCSARRTSVYLDAVNLAVRCLHNKLRRTKMFTILTQADLPGKSASGWGGQSPFYPKFLTRGYYGDVSSTAGNGKVVGEVWMFQEIQNEVSLNVGW